MTGSCVVCGRKGKRVCPHHEGAICPSCCADRRNSEWICPFACPHNPFGSDYERFSEIEGRVLGWIDGFILEHTEPGRRILKNPPRNPQDAVIALRRMYFSRDIFEGQRPLDAFAAGEAARGISSDERRVIDGMRKARAALLEIQDLPGPPFTRAKDLLRGEDLLIADRSLSEQASRYDCILVAIYPVTHYVRPFGAGQTIPRQDLAALRELTDRLAEEARERGEEEDPSVFLLDRMTEVFDCVCAIAKARMDHLMESLDFSPGRLLFRIVGDREKLLDALRARPDFEVDEQECAPGMVAFRWLRLGPSKAFEEEHPEYRSSEDRSGFVGGLGIVRVSETHLAADTMKAVTREFCGRLLERDFGAFLRFEGEGHMDMNERLRESFEAAGEEGDGEDESGRIRRPAVAPAKPARSAIPLEIQQQILQRHSDEHYRRFLDEPVPAIDGWTPRDAAASPAMRPHLIELMKEHVNGMERRARQEGIRIDIAWVLEELGLTELLR